MDISGTLHFYSGEDKELFFVFDDDVAQVLNDHESFDVDELESRRVWISVGTQRRIHRRTLSSSRKQTEIKVSLCSKASMEGLGALTTLYKWFRLRGRPRPKPFRVIGTLSREWLDGQRVWELRITEPTGLVTPPGLPRRRKAAPQERKSFNRRRIILRDLVKAGKPAEKLALALAVGDYPSPRYGCLWRKEFLDSERIEIRKLGILADIDVWNNVKQTPEAVIEVKAQKVSRFPTAPRFYLSEGEWRSYGTAKKNKIPYFLWLFQYRDLSYFKKSPGKNKLIVFDELLPEWLGSDGYIVLPMNRGGSTYSIDM